MSTLFFQSETRDNTLSSFSNFGIPYVHVLAPGTDILSTAPNGGYVSGSGTSFACPHISGLAGVVMSLIDDADTETISIQGKILKGLVFCKENNLTKDALPTVHNCRGNFISNLIFDYVLFSTYQSCKSLYIELPAV